MEEHKSFLRVVCSWQATLSFHAPLKSAGKASYSHPHHLSLLALFLPQTLASAQQEVRERNDQIAKLHARVAELEGGQPAPAPAATPAAATAAGGTEGNTTATATATAGGGGAVARPTRSVSPAPASQQQQQQRGASPTTAGRSAMAVVPEAGAGGDDGGEASLRNRLMARSE